MEKNINACCCSLDVNFKIKYNKSRNPVQQKKKTCKGCGAPVFPPRFSWCCNDCFNTFDPHSVKRAVDKRDKYICQLCYVVTKRSNREYDHIKPFSEGGLTILSNMRTLCKRCHKKVTRHWNLFKRVKK